jgi:hypothetical protein
MMMMMMGHAHKIIKNISLKSTAYMSCYRRSYIKNVQTDYFPECTRPFGEISQIFPYESLFDLFYQFDILVFIGSKNRLKIIFLKTQFVWVCILMITMMMMIMILSHYVMILRDKV